MPLSLSNLAISTHDQGDYPRAEPLYRQALEIRKKALGENHPDYATSLNNLASWYWAQGDYARAEPLYRQARRSGKKAWARTTPHYATSLNNLAAAVPGPRRLRAGRTALPARSGDHEEGLRGEPPGLCHQPDQSGPPVPLPRRLLAPNRCSVRQWRSFAIISRQLRPCNRSGSNWQCCKPIMTISTAIWI